MRRQRPKQLNIPLDPNEVCFFFAQPFQMAAHEGRIVVAANDEVADHFLPTLMEETGIVWMPMTLSAQECKAVLTAMDDPKPEQVEIIFALDELHKDERLTMKLSEFELLMTFNSLR